MRTDKEGSALRAQAADAFCTSEAILQHEDPHAAGAVDLDGLRSCGTGVGFDQARVGDVEVLTGLARGGGLDGRFYRGEGLAGGVWFGRWGRERVY